MRYTPDGLVLRFVFAQLYRRVRYEDGSAAAALTGGVIDDRENAEVVGKALVLLAVRRPKVVLLYAYREDGAFAVLGGDVFYKVFVLGALLEAARVFAYYTGARVRRGARVGGKEDPL